MSIESRLICDGCGDVILVRTDAATRALRVEAQLQLGAIYSVLGGDCCRGCRQVRDQGDFAGTPIGQAIGAPAALATWPIGG